MSVRLDKLQKAFGEVLTPSFPDASILWTYSQPTGEQLKQDRISLRLLSGPTLTNQTRVRGVTFTPPASILFTIPTVTPGARYWLNVNGYQYFRDAVLGDTVDTIRDALVTALNLDLFDPFTALAGVDPGSFLLTPDSFGSINWVSKSSNIDVTTLTLEEDAALFTVGLSSMVVEVQAWSKKDKLFNGASSMINKLLDVVQRRSTVNQFYKAGVAFTDKGFPTDISALSGPNWETRATISFTVTMPSTDVERVATLGNVSLSFQILNSSGSSATSNEFLVSAQ